ncbi:MAG: 2OG-Fe(II) oxygenase [Candidatus Levybacteria bacterium]|nr:2OG-Fe(II) oxygenase [Candidatus Levybacteria bacterium]
MNHIENRENMNHIENQWGVERLSPDNSAEACELLPALASNEIAAIQIAQFLGRQDLDIVIQNMSRQNIQWYENREFQQGRIGINATGFGYESGGKQRYFDLTPEAAKVRDEIFKGASNPIDKIIKFFSSNGYNASIATEPGMQNAQYFAGLIRAMGAKSTLHFDYAPNQLPGWSVSDADEQYGLVLYLQMPTEGGELTVYNRPWQPEDESHNNDIGQKGRYGFAEDFLEDTPHATISPKAGDLVVFKTRNFHQVAAINSDKPRLGLTTFMTLKDGSLSLWS